MDLALPQPSSWGAELLVASSEQVLVLQTQKERELCSRAPLCCEPRAETRRFCGRCQVSWLYDARPGGVWAWGCGRASPIQGATPGTAGSSLPHQQF